MVTGSDKHGIVRCVLQTIERLENGLQIVTTMCRCYIKVLPQDCHSQAEVTCLDCAAEVAKACFERHDRGQL